MSNISVPMESIRCPYTVYSIHVFISIIYYLPETEYFTNACSRFGRNTCKWNGCTVSVQYTVGFIFHLHLPLYSHFPQFFVFVFWSYCFSDFSDFFDSLILWFYVFIFPNQPIRMDFDLDLVKFQFTWIGLEGSTDERWIAFDCYSLLCIIGMNELTSMPRSAIKNQLTLCNGNFIISNTASNMTFLVHFVFIWHMQTFWLCGIHSFFSN